MDILTQNNEIVESLITEAHKFYNLRYQMGNGGNLSARVPGTDLMIVKGTDVDFAHVSRDTLVVTDFDGKVKEGAVRPSKEALLHGALYRRCIDLGAIMHCHSPWATAWAACHEELEFSTHHSLLKLGGCCPVFDTHSYVVHSEYFEVIFKKLDENPAINSFLLRRHGQVTLAGNIHAAAHLAELVEETAQISLLSRL